MENSQPQIALILTDKKIVTISGEVKTEKNNSYVRTKYEFI